MALLPIFCVARSSRTDPSMLVARALKIGEIADGGMPPTYETMHYYLNSAKTRKNHRRSIPDGTDVLVGDSLHQVD